jgi:hypothetical protein
MGSCRDSNAGPLANCAWVYPKRAIMFIRIVCWNKMLVGYTHNHTTSCDVISNCVEEPARGLNLHHRTCAIVVAVDDEM